MATVNTPPAKMAGPSIVWLRDDLRIADNPALSAAADRRAPVVVLFVLESDASVARPRGGASRWWLHHSLQSLAASLGALGVSLLLRRGRSADIVPALIAEVGAGAIYWNRRYGLGEREQDAAIKREARGLGLEAKSFGATLLFEPWEIQTGGGTPFAVFTPFWNACSSAPPRRSALAAPTELSSYGGRLSGEELADWGLLPTRPDWAGGLRDTWAPGETEALRKLADFGRDGVDGYDRDRDFPAADATSHLSPHLRFGEVSPHQVWEQFREDGREDAGKLLAELGWREFNYHLLYHHPHLATENYRGSFDRFPWNSPDDKVDAWRKGLTGFPLVDAAMRQLWQTGWMHNRMRMVSASFLIKNLLVDWHIGEQWFWDTLVDADPANNTANWQWVAGSGADAAPFFRVFNPVLQSKKFDPDGTFVRRFVPELADLDGATVHEPWRDIAASTSAYPLPIVDLKETRAAALAAYEQTR